MGNCVRQKPASCGRYKSFLGLIYKRSIILSQSLTLKSSIFAVVMAWKHSRPGLTIAEIIDDFWQYKGNNDVISSF